MMTRLVALSILTYHSRAEKRKFCVGLRTIREHTVQLFRETPLANELYKALDVMLN